MSRVAGKMYCANSVAIGKDVCQCFDRYLFLTVMGVTNNFKEVRVDRILRMNAIRLTFTAIAFFAIAILSCLAIINPLFAQIAEPTTQEIMSFITALGGLKGAGAFVIAGIVVQGLMLLFRSKLGDFAGKFKILVVYFLSIASGIIALKIAGVDIGAAFVHSNTLAALQVFLNQLYKQFFEKTN